MINNSYYIAIMVQSCENSQKKFTATLLRRPTLEISNAQKEWLVE